MSFSDIQDKLTNLKSFQSYLSHIVNSIENNDYHLPTVDKVSKMITQYFEEVNITSDEDSTGNDDNNSTEVDDNNSVKSNPESDDSDIVEIDPESSDTDESVDGLNDIFYSNTNHSKTPIQKPVVVEDKYLVELKELSYGNELNLQDIKLYQKDKTHVDRLNRFIDRSLVY